MFKRWKEEWYLRNAKNIAIEFEQRRIDLESKLQDELNQIESEWNFKKDSLILSIDKQRKNLELLEEEVKYRLSQLELRKLELIQSDNDLKQKIAILEAKAHPSGVWAEAFTLGVSKCWDLLIPSMTENIEKMKARIKEDCTREAIGRFNASNKK